MKSERIPTPGDPDYFDYVTKKGKYAALANAKKKIIAKPATGIVKTKKSGSEELLDEMLAGKGLNKKRKRGLSGSAKIIKSAF